MGPATLTRLSFSDTFHLDLAAVEAGVPIEILSGFLEKSGVAWKDLYEVVIPARTLKHRRSRAQALSADESDKLARFVRVFDHAVRVFGEMDKARRWLSKPKRRFEERSPFQMLKTEVGARMVEEMLGQIEHGLFA